MHAIAIDNKLLHLKELVSTSQWDPNAVIPPGSSLYLVVQLTNATLPSHVLDATTAVLTLRDAADTTDSTAALTLRLRHGKQSYSTSSLNEHTLWIRVDWVSASRLMGSPKGVHSLVLHVSNHHFLEA